jgi:hypothetical protein
MVLLNVREYLGRELRYIQAGVSSAWNKINPAMVKKSVYDRRAPLWTGIRGGGGHLSVKQNIVNRAFGAASQSVSKGKGTLMDRLAAVKAALKDKKADDLKELAAKYAKVAKPLRYTKPKVPASEIKKMFA